jgi:hypothetical protein
MELINKHASLSKQLEEAMSQWETWSETLESLKNKNLEL